MNKDVLRKHHIYCETEEEAIKAKDVLSAVGEEVLDVGRIGVPAPCVLCYGPYYKRWGGRVLGQIGELRTTRINFKDLGAK